MGSQHPTSSSGGGGSTPQRTRRRRSPSQAEQARREAWGREWGKVGAAYKKQRLAKEGR